MQCNQTNNNIKIHHFLRCRNPWTE